MCHEKGTKICNENENETISCKTQIGSLQRLTSKVDRDETRTRVVYKRRWKNFAQFVMLSDSYERSQKSVRLRELDKSLATSRGLRVFLIKELFWPIYERSPWNQFLMIELTWLTLSQLMSLKIVSVNPLEILIRSHRQESRAWVSHVHSFNVVKTARDDIN